MSRLGIAVTSEPGAQLRVEGGDARLNLGGDLGGLADDDPQIVVVVRRRDQRGPGAAVAEPQEHPFLTVSYAGRSPDQAAAEGTRERGPGEQQIGSQSALLPGRVDDEASTLKYFCVGPLRGGDDVRRGSRVNLPVAGLACYRDLRQRALIMSGTR